MAFTDDEEWAPVDFTGVFPGAVWGRLSAKRTDGAFWLSHLLDVCVRTHGGENAAPAEYAAARAVVERMAAASSEAEPTITEINAVFFALFTALGELQNNLGPSVAPSEVYIDFLICARSPRSWHLRVVYAVVPSERFRHQLHLEWHTTTPEDEALLGLPATASTYAAEHRGVRFSPGCPAVPMDPWDLRMYAALQKGG